MKNNYSVTTKFWKYIIENIKSVTIEHPKTSHKLSKTKKISQVCGAK